MSSNARSWLPLQRWTWGLVCAHSPSCDLTVYYLQRPYLIHFDTCGLNPCHHPLYLYKEFIKKIPFPCRVPCRHSAMTGANGVATTNTPPWSSTATMAWVLFSWIILSISFYRLAPRYPTAKQSAWILTTISSAVMTLSSIPFLYDYFSNGGSVKYVRMIPSLSISVSRFFQSYLVMWVVSSFSKILSNRIFKSDLSLGLVYYRSQVGLLTGWIHHATYIMIVELAIRRSWTHIFCLCSAMEVSFFFSSQSRVQTPSKRTQGAHLLSRFYDITPRLQKQHRLRRSLLSHPHSIPHHPWHIILSTW